MSKTYQECFTELVAESRDRIECNPSLYWDEAVREAVEDSLFGGYTSETIQNILDESTPNDEWQIYCDDMGDYHEVNKAMAYTAIREDIIEELSEEFE